MRRRSPNPRETVPLHLMHHEPPHRFELDEQKFCQNLRSARRGVAPGPSGMSCEHLHPTRPPHVLLHVRTVGARVKPSGGVRGIVTSDVIRRIVACTMAQQLSEKVKTATSSFQYARMHFARTSSNLRHGWERHSGDDRRHLGFRSDVSKSHAPRLVRCRR